MAKTKATTVSAAAQTGDRLKTLIALRAHLSQAIDTCQSMRDLASLTQRLQSVLAEIAELEPRRAAGDGIDQISQRRAARRSGTSSGSTRAASPS